MSFFVRNLLLSLLLLPALLSGCATPQKPLTGLVPGRTVETVQSSISISVSAGTQSTGGRGYLAYQAPALFHLVLLTPFGQTVLEAFSENDRFTCVVPDRRVAYTGLVSELPDNSVLKSVDLLKWVMAPAPFPVPAPAAGETVQVSGVSYRFDKNGMLERKVSSEGDQVSYRNYQSIEGIAFPESVEVQNRYGAKVRIVFDEPQLNATVEESTLKPDLTGLSVLPLAEFKSL
jgi:outer membrane biogenesis lipoprotein LolB